MTTHLQQARRSFIKNSMGIIGLSILPNIDIFAEKTLNKYTIGSKGIESSKISKLNTCFKNSSLDISISLDNQKSNIYLIGNTETFSFIELENSIKPQALLILENCNNGAKFSEILSFCHYKGIHLAKIEKWTENDNSKKAFEKISFYETTVDAAKIHQSINYLNILSKLTVGTGLQIK